MDKEKEIEEMASVLERAKISAIVTIGSLNKGFGYWYADSLVNAGYGNVKQAVKEFAAFMHGLVPIYCKGGNQLAFHREIDKKIKELYGEEE